MNLLYKKFFEENLNLMASWEMNTNPSMLVVEKTNTYYSNQIFKSYSSFVLVNH